MHYCITLFVISPLSENMLDPFGLRSRPQDELHELQAQLGYCFVIENH